jgi:hypothetical protein
MQRQLWNQRQQWESDLLFSACFFLFRPGGTRGCLFFGLSAGCLPLVCCLMSDACRSLLCCLLSAIYCLDLLSALWCLMSDVCYLLTRIFPGSAFLHDCISSFLSVYLAAYLFSHHWLHIYYCGCPH